MAKKPKSAQPQSPFKTVVQNLPFHHFEEQRTFTGMYKNTVTLGEDDETFQANVFVDLETGEEKYLQNSYSIDKAIKAARAEFSEGVSGIIFQIEFLGKTTVKGKPFNQFKVGYCTEEEYDAFNEGK